MGAERDINYEIERLEQKLTETTPESEKNYIKDKLRALYDQLG